VAKQWNAQHGMGTLEVIRHQDHSEMGECNITSTQQQTQGETTTNGYAEHHPSEASIVL
jgi:hypothetical protein